MVVQNIVQNISTSELCIWVGLVSMDMKLTRTSLKKACENSSPCKADIFVKTLQENSLYRKH